MVAESPMRCPGSLCPLQPGPHHPYPPSPQGPPQKTSHHNGTEGPRGNTFLRQAEEAGPFGSGPQASSADDGTAQGLPRRSGGPGGLTGKTVSIPLRGSISCNQGILSGEIQGKNASQSPYGEASFATGGPWRWLPLAGSCRNPLTGKHLLQLLRVPRRHPEGVRAHVAIPLRGSIFCNYILIKRNGRLIKILSQSPYGETSFATKPGIFAHASCSKPWVAIPLRGSIFCNAEDVLKACALMEVAIPLRGSIFCNIFSG